MAASLSCQLGLVLYHKKGKQEKKQKNSIYSIAESDKGQRERGGDGVTDRE